MSFERYPKKTANNKDPTDHNENTEENIPPQTISDDNILSDTAKTVTPVEFIGHNKEPIEYPPVPKCKTPDAFNIAFQCGTKDVTFKLKCKELETSKENPKSTFECRLVDEEQCLNMVIAMSAANLKCKRVQAIHNNDADVSIADNDEETILVREIDNKNEDNYLPRE